MSSTDELLDRIRGFLAGALRSPRDSEGIEPHTALISGGLLSSIDVLSLVAFLEDELGIEFQAFEISPDYLDSLADIVSLCESKLSRR